ncbi:MAG: CBS domain-containing protein [Candidatus Heimdallarchaeota archaeon]
MTTPILPDLLELRRLRKIIGLTQDELAHRAGVSQSMIAKMETGSLNPSYEVVRRIYQVLAVAEGQSQTKAFEIMSPVIAVRVDNTIQSVVDLMKKDGISQLPVFSQENKNVGRITEQTLLDILLEGRNLKDIADQPVESIMEPIFPVIGYETPLRAITELLRFSSAVLVSQKDGNISGIITKADLLNTSR